MIAPMAGLLKERKAEWEEIEELIDYFGDVYDKVVELVPEEEEIEDIDDDELYDDGDMGGYHVSSIRPDEPKEVDPWSSVNEYMSGKHEPPIAAPVYDPSIVTPSDEEIINNYYKEEAKKEQYIPFVEEKVKSKEIKSTGSIL